MIWFWTRDHQCLRFETRYDNDTAEFVVAIEYPDGRQVSERFSDIGTFRSRLVDLEQQLESDRWTQSGQPVLVPEGFPNRRLAPDMSTAADARVDKTVATRTYTVGSRTFVIVVSGTPVPSHVLWTVEIVKEEGRSGQEIIIPGMDGVLARTEDSVFARACDRIDKWLISKR